MPEKKYSSQEVEAKWQKSWREKGLYQASDFDKREKAYVLVEFPYPSGDGLHVGHCLSYIAQDIVARSLRMKGKNVLYPMGWDAFGLPTENYAIKNKVKPQVATAKNIATFKHQINSLGISFDWSREVNTTDPKFYKWTQWIFLQLYKKGLAEKKEVPINWCPSCKIGLAFEEVVDGKCERCGTEVEKRTIKQWVLKIIKYADRLIADLDTVDFSPEIKQQQINWIGRSEGVMIEFPISNSRSTIEVFTTRPDTIFGATYMVLAPEHDLIHTLEDKIENLTEVKKYIEKAGKKSDRERQVQKEKTGVELKGLKAINPATKEEIPIWVADYVLTGYGTGAIMSVPAHDERDYEFAKKYGLSIIDVIDGKKTAKLVFEGSMKNSGKYNGLKSDTAIKKMGADFGKNTIQYKLRDWIFSRQHYWGEPIPIIHCTGCGIVPVDEKDLPVVLPDVDHYEPTDTGESPLAKITEWVNVKCPKCKEEAKRETDTMPNWAGSSWYFLRYTDPNNDKELADTKKLKYWLPVDLYNGGAEHTTLHLLYSRFWHKFLYDIKAVPTLEPYQVRVHHGMVLAADGQKMSKSRGNVVTPDGFVKKYGADVFRMYLMFMGEYDQVKNWNEKNLAGVARFLKRVWKYSNEVTIHDKNNAEQLSALHTAIFKINTDLQRRSFNTTISNLMILFNALQTKKTIHREVLSDAVKLIAPFSPHLAEELWHRVLGNNSSIHEQSWPIFDKSLVLASDLVIGVQVNGKVRGEIEISDTMSEKDVRAIALALPAVQKHIGEARVKKFIYVKNRIISIVV